MQLGLFDPPPPVDARPVDTRRRDRDGYLWTPTGRLDRYMKNLAQIWEDTKSGIRDDYHPAPDSTDPFSVALRIHRAHKKGKTT